jgi:hypothetical protein
MGIVKTHRYETRARWLGGRRLVLEAPDKPTQRCIVGAALATPVQLSVDVRVSGAAAGSVA